MVYFLESPRTCFGENRSDISNLNPSFFCTCCPNPSKKSNEKATQKRKANKGQPTNPKIVSLCQQPTLEGLNHFALNWAFNEPKSGELGVNSVVDHVDGGGGELDDFRLADGEKKLFDPK